MNYVSRCSPFWFLNPLKYLFVQSLSRLLAGNPHSWAHSSFLLFISTVLVRLIYFCIFKWSVLLFVEILTFGFCLVTFECDAYLPVDHSLVYSYHKMFLLLFSLIFTAWAWFRTIFLDLYLVFLFSVAPRSSLLQKWPSVVNFPQPVKLVFPILIHDECKPMSMATNAYIAFYSYNFILFLSSINVMKILTFSVTLSTYSITYSGKFAHYLGKF